MSEQMHPNRDTEGRPLVTFALFAYNQERFIREAVEGALSQTYQPLEIILSDDCSQDRTFEIIQQCASEYCGPHTVKLNRNSSNRGVGRHVNRMFELSTGVLLIAAAGDDISLPERTEILVSAWEAAGRPPTICSGASVIDQNGNSVAPRYTGYDGAFPAPDETTDQSLLHHARNGSRNLLGCSAGWSRQMFDQFGPLAAGVVNEDNAFGFRSWLCGRIAYDKRLLLKYRTHDTNLYNSSRLSVLTSVAEFAASESVRATRARWIIEVLQQHLRDLGVARALNMKSPHLLNEVEAVLRHRIEINRILANWEDRTLPERLSSIFQLWRHAEYGLMKSQLVRLSPSLYCRIRSAGRRIKDGIRDSRGGMRGAA